MWCLLRSFLVFSDSHEFAVPKRSIFYAYKSLFSHLHVLQKFIQSISLFVPEFHQKQKGSQRNTHNIHHLNPLCCWGWSQVQLSLGKKRVRMYTLDTHRWPRQLFNLTFTPRGKLEIRSPVCLWMLLETRVPTWNPQSQGDSPCSPLLHHTAIRSISHTNIQCRKQFLSNLISLVCMCVCKWHVCIQFFCNSFRCGTTVHSGLRWTV